MDNFKTKNFFSRLKGRGRQLMPIKRQNQLDKKLVVSLANSRLPNFKQFCYLSKALTAKEWLAIKTLGVIIVVCLLIIGANAYLNNIERLPQAGGEYTEGLIGSPRFINPTLAQNDADRDLAKLVFSGLFKYNPQGELVPDLAASYTISTDQKVYNIVLKENLKWQDGEPLTVDDVVFTVTMIQDPGLKSPLQLSLKGVGVEKADDRTIKFVLSEPFAPFLSSLIFGILPEHTWNAIPPANAALAEYNLKPVGNGPYKFSSLTKDRSGNVKEYVLAINENYHEQLPYIQKIIFKFYPDFETGAEALAGKKVEGLSFLPPNLNDAVKKNKNLVFYSLHLPQYTAIFFNQKNNEFLRDKNVRIALANSLDKPQIIKEALKQGETDSQEPLTREGEIIHGPILPGFIGYNPDIKKYNYNAEVANKILDDAGWKRMSVEDYQKLQAEAKAKEEESQKSAQGGSPVGGHKNTKTQKQETTGSSQETAAQNQNVNTNVNTDVSENVEPTTELPPEPAFYRYKKDKTANKFLTIKLTAVDLPESSIVAKLIRDYWQAIGVKVELNLVDGFHIGREVINIRQYEALLYSEILGSDPDPYAFWHSSQNQAPGVNLAIFSDRNVDKLLEDARQTNDNAKREEYYKKFQDILADQLPAIFLYNPTYTYAMDKVIKGINTERIAVPADRFANIVNWYIKTKVRFKKEN